MRPDPRPPPWCRDVRLETPSEPLASSARWPAAAAGTFAPAMSRHLRVLLQAGIVADERTARDARARVFRLRPQSMVALHAWLDQL